jgi:hypothetical protein
MLYIEKNNKAFKYFFLFRKMKKSTKRKKWLKISLIVVGVIIGLLILWGIIAWLLSLSEPKESIYKTDAECPKFFGCSEDDCYTICKAACEKEWGILRVNRVYPYVRGGGSVCSCDCVIKE